MTIKSDFDRDLITWREELTKQDGFPTGKEHAKWGFIQGMKKASEIVDNSHRSDAQIEIWKAIKEFES